MSQAQRRLVSRGPIAGTLATLLVAVGLRFFGLDALSLWGDEAYSWTLANAGVGDAVRATIADVHPPLYYLLLHFWLALAGSSEYALRFPSALASVLSVALLARWGRLLGGWRVAVLVALLGATAPMWVHYAQEARMYALETLGGLVATVVLYAILQRAMARGVRTVPVSWWLTYILSAALSLWVDYFPAFVFLAHNAVVIGTVAFGPAGQRRSLLGAWLVAQGAILLLYAPWLALATLDGKIQEAGGGGAPAFLDQAHHLWRSFVLGSWVRDSTSLPTVSRPWEPQLLLAVAIVALLGVVSWLSAPGKNAFPLGPWYLIISLVIPAVAFFILMVLRPQFHPRYLLAATPSLYLMIAVGIEALRYQRSWLPGIGALVCLVAFASGLWAHYSAPGIPRGNARQLRELLAAQVGRDDVILFEMPQPTEFEAYYYLASAARKTEARVVTVAVDPSSIPPELLQPLEGSQRVMWMSWRYGSRDIWGLMPYLLERRGRNVGDTASALFRLRWYDSFDGQEIVLGDNASLAARFGEILLMESVVYGGSGESNGLPSGEAAWVRLRGRALNAPPGHLKASLRLSDARGQVVAQEDVSLYNALGRPAPLWKTDDAIDVVAILRVPAGTIPGTHDLQLRIYAVSDPADVAHWSEISVAGGGPALPLGALQVERARKVFAPDDLLMPHSLRPPLRLGDLELLGYGLGEGPGAESEPLTMRMGDPLVIRLFWRAYQAPTTDQPLTIRLSDGAGVMRHEWARRPTDGRFPPTQWRAGELVADRQRVILPAGLPAGAYTVSLQGKEGNALSLGTVSLQDRRRSSEQATPSRPFLATVGGFAELVGYDLADVRSAGSALGVTLYWRARGTALEPYTVFVHLSDADDRVLAQHDGAPQKGTAPTSSWLAGEAVVDQHILPLPRSLPPGVYLLYAGLYDPLTGVRLRADDGGDRLHLGSVTIPPP